jgi:hypothetical protein
MTNTLGNQSNRRKTKYDTRSADELKTRVMSVKPKKQKTVENKVEESTRELSFVDNQNMYGEFLEYFYSKFRSHRDELTEKASFNREKKVMTGSTPYIAIAMDMFLKENYSEYRIATLKDLDQNLDFSKGYEIDAGIILRFGKMSDNDISINLWNQLRIKDPGVSNYLPVWFDLRGLKLDENLNFKISKESKYKKNASCFNKKEKSLFSKTDNFGLPLNEPSSESRILYNNNKLTLSLGILNNEGDIIAEKVPFNYSSDDSRIILAKQVK